MTGDADSREIFGLYSAYYDLLYRDKDYKGEADFALSFLNDSALADHDIADFGCGTGRHAIEFARKGFNVTGVELSDTMLQMADRNLSVNTDVRDRVKFIQGNVCNVSTGEKYNALFMLFHVLGYLNTNSEILEALRNIGDHLVNGGILVFDFWYGPAVLSILPEQRIKTLENDDLKIIRTALPIMKYNDNVVEVNYNIEAEWTESGKKKDFNERHRMRYFFIPELELLLNASGFKVMRMSEWMSGAELSEATWSGVCAAIYTGEKNP